MSKLDRIIARKLAFSFAHSTESKLSQNFAALHGPAPFGLAGSNPDRGPDQENSSPSGELFSWRTRPDLNRRSPP